MLSRKEKSVMKVIYYEAVKNDGTCLMRPIDILKGIPYTFEFSHESLMGVIDELELDDYYDYVESEKKGEKILVFNLHQKGHAFYREILSEKRVLYRKIYFTIGGVIASFILSLILKSFIR